MGQAVGHGWIKNVSLSQFSVPPEKGKKEISDDVAKTAGVAPRCRTISLYEEDFQRINGRGDEKDRSQLILTTLLNMLAFKSNKL